MTISTCDLYDERGDELQSVTTQFISVGGVHQFTGPIRTGRCFESNVDVKKLVATRVRVPCSWWTGRAP